MHSEAEDERTRLPLACKVSELTYEQRQRQRDLYRKLWAGVKEVRELQDGYAFRHSADGDTLLAIAEFVSNERLCCPFFEFEISVGRGGGPLWLRMSGEEGVKRVLEMDVGAWGSG